MEGDATLPQHRASLGRRLRFGVEEHESAYALLAARAVGARVRRAFSPAECAQTASSGHCGQTFSLYGHWDTSAVGCAALLQADRRAAIPTGLWTRLRSRTRAFVHAAPSNAVYNLEFSPDGARVAAMCGDGSVSLFDPLSPSTRPVTTVEHAHRGGTNVGRFVRHHFLLTGGEDNCIRMWDVRNLSREVRCAGGHFGWIKNIEWIDAPFEPGGGILASSAFDDVILLWTADCTPYMDERASRVCVDDAVSRICVPSGGNMLVVGLASGPIVLVHNLHLPMLAADCGQKGMRRADSCERRRNRLELVRQDGDLYASSLDADPARRFLLARCTSFGDEMMWVYDLTPPGEIDETDRREGFCVRPNRRMLVAEERSTELDVDFIKGCAVSCDGRIACSASGNGVKLFDVHSAARDFHSARSGPLKMTPFVQLIAHAMPALACRFSPTGPFLASGAMDGTVAFYSPRV
eukprot:Opistho-1_new@19167